MVFPCLYAAHSTAAQTDRIDTLITEKKLIPEQTMLWEQDKTSPGDEALQYRLAQLQSWQKEFPATLDMPDKLQGVQAKNNDEAKSQLLNWPVKSEKATLTLDKSGHQNPDHKPARKLQADYRITSGTENKLLLASQLKQPEKEKHPQAQGPEKPIKNDSTYTEVEGGLSYDILNNNLDDWSGQYLYAEHLYSNGKKVYGSLNRSERFGLQDLEQRLGLYQPHRQKLSSTMELSHSPDHNIVPEYSAAAKLHYNVRQDSILNLGVRYSSYTLLDSTNLDASVEKYTRNFRFSYGILSSQIHYDNTSSSHRFVHSLGMDYFYGDRNKAGLYLSQGDALEYDGSAKHSIISTQGKSVRGRYWFHSDWALIYEVRHQRQGKYYKHTGFVLGVRHRY